MKSKLILVTLLILNYSCNTVNKPLADAEKDKIKSEIKEVVNMYIRGCEEANFELIKEPCLDSPDFVYLTSGYALNFKDAVALSEPTIEALLNQKFSILEEKYSILDRSTALCTISSKLVSNYKDGHSEHYNPFVNMFLLKKIDETWKVVSVAESYVIQPG